MTNVELVKQMYSDLASGNAPAALAIFDPAIEWRECRVCPSWKTTVYTSGPNRS